MRRVLLFAVLSIALGWSLLAFSRMVEHPPATPAVSQEGWPEGLAGLLNDPGRVYGYWGPLGGIGSSFHAGDTGEVNTFLAQYARLKGTALTLFLHTRRENEDKWLESRKVGYD
jgi:hypothetical protein